MFEWVVPLMRTVTRIAANVCTAAGLLGLILFAAIGIVKFYDHLLYEEDFHEDQD